jgi:ankyrin repeat protein
VVDTQLGPLRLAVESLLQDVPDIDDHREEEGTVLQLADMKGNKRILEMLLDKGADPNTSAGGVGIALLAAGHFDGRIPGARPSPYLGRTRRLRR